MTTASDIDESFTKALNEAGELYNDDRLDECIEKTRALLANDAMPRYHCMKALLLLASTLGDWLDASNCHTEAESPWRVTRRWHIEGEDAELDKYVDDVREHLDEVGADLARTDPDAYDFDDDDVDDRIAAHEEHVKDATAAMETLELPDDEMEVELLVGVPATEVAALADVPAIKIAAPAEGGSGIADGADPQAPQGQG